METIPYPAHVGQRSHRAESEGQVALKVSGLFKNLKLTEKLKEWYNEYI